MRISEGINSLVESFGLLQCCAHGCRLATCSQVDQVNTGVNTVEVQYMVVLTSGECTEVIVDDLLPYEIVYNNRGSASFRCAELQVCLISKRIWEHTSHFVQRLLFDANVHACD